MSVEYQLNSQLKFIEYLKLMFFSHLSLFHHHHHHHHGHQRQQQQQ